MTLPNRIIARRGGQQREYKIARSLLLRPVPGLQPNDYGQQDHHK
jgi:hypothetical protein